MHEGFKPLPGLNLNLLIYCLDSGVHYTVGSFIVNIANYIWLITIMIILVGLFIRADKSSLISLTVWIVAELIMARIAPEIAALEDKQFARTLWYVTWAVFDTVCVGLLFLIHVGFRITPSNYSKFICLSFLVLLSFQAARYLDRMILQADILVEVYKFGVPAVQLAVPLVSFYWLAMNLKLIKNEKRI